MIDHLGIAVTNLERSGRFYQATLKALGYEKIKISMHSMSFGVLHGEKKSSDPDGEFWISLGCPNLPLAHFAFSTTSRAAVDAFYLAAIDAGGKGNGEPGLRTHYHDSYYAAFIIDPDGYGIEAVCHLGS